MKRAVGILFVFSILILFQTPVFASSDAISGICSQDALKNVGENMPSEVKEWLDEELVSELEKGEHADVSAIASKGFDADGTKNILQKALDYLLSPLLSVLFKCLSLCACSSIVSAFCREREGSKQAVQFVWSLCVCLALWSIGQGGLSLMKSAIDSVTVFLRALLPTIGALYVAGGNFTAGAVEEGMLLLILELMEGFCRSALVPMVGVAFALSLLSRIWGDGRADGMAKAVCRCLSILLTLLATILSGVAAYQHTVAQSADGLLSRSVKFAASGVIPVIGGTLGDAVGTAMGAVAFLRSAAGGLMATTVVILLLTPILQLLGTRLALYLSSILAQAMGCDGESGLLSQLTAVFDLAIAILAVCMLTLIIVLALFIRCATAAV